MTRISSPGLAHPQSVFVFPRCRTMLLPKMGLTNGYGALSTAEKAVNEMKTLVAAVRTSKRKDLKSLLAFIAIGSSRIRKLPSVPFIKLPQPPNQVGCAG